MIHRCLVVDDEALARELIVSHLAQLAEFEVVDVCASALEARVVLRDRSVDLIFLDIEMPVLRGTDLIKGLRQPPAVIFTTAYRNYAVDGFALDAVDYLLKPITFERFFQATERYLRRLPMEGNATATENNVVSEVAPAGAARKDYVFVRKDRKRIRLKLADITYLESLKDYVRITLINGEDLVIKYTLTGLSELLDGRFLRIHRSFVVNRDRVTAFTRQDVELEGRELPIGEVYREEVLGWLEG